MVTEQGTHVILDPPLKAMEQWCERGSLFDLCRGIVGVVGVVVARRSVGAVVADEGDGEVLG